MVEVYVANCKPHNWDTYDCEDKRLYIFSAKSRVEEMIYLMSVTLKEVEGTVNIAFEGCSDREEGQVGLVYEQSEIINMYSIH